MKKLNLLIAMLAFSLGLMAHPVDMETAMQLAGRFMVANQRSTTEAMTLAYTEKTDSGLNVCYVFNCQPKGFVIVAADDRMKPILGYSTESSFDLVAAEEGPRVFFDAYRSDLQTAIDTQMEQSPEIAAQWRQLRANGTLPQRGSRTVGPLCASTWHQTQLYNDQCPEDPEGNNGHVKAGCVANAMAQIMRYWEWPKSGVGSHSYYCLGYGTLSANFAEADYRYEFMPDFLDYTSPQYEVDAVALLEYHAGVSVNMSYGASASAALSSTATDAFVEYFRYSDQTTLKHRTLFSDARWLELMANEIDHGRPMFYSAYSFSKDGIRGAHHAFVCDGYDENDFFHFNWGWQGFDNGFYSINGMDLTNHAYNYVHAVTVNLEPNAEYYEQPMPVSDVEIELYAFGSGVLGSITAPTQTIGGDALASIDSIVLLANGSVFQVFADPQPGEELAFECFFDNDPGNLVCFEVYPVTSGGRGRAVIDNEIWSYSCKPITFQLHDAAGNGWLSPAISVMDEQGMMYRIGLDEGYDGTVTVDVPFEENITLFWNYCNNGYVDGDEECRFEVFDYKGDLIYAQTERPKVGELFTFFNALDYMISPEYITAENEYLEDGRFGVHIYWRLENPNQWFRGYHLERYSDLNGDADESFNFIGGGLVNDFFDEVPKGTYYYRIVAFYETGIGAPDRSSFAPNLDDPTLDYAMVVVTSVDEQFDMQHATVKVFNALGQQVYSGEASSMNTDEWKSGIYVLNYTFNDGRTISVKQLRP